MGLLDWLTEGVGSDMGGSSMGSGYKPEPPMPPVQMTGADAPSLAPPSPLPSPVQATSAYQSPGSAPPSPDESSFPPAGDPITAGGPSDGGPGIFQPGASDPMTAGGVPFAPGGDPMTAGGAMPGGPGLPPPERVPLPTARPPGLGGNPAAALPPNAAPTAGLPPVITGTGPMAPGAPPPSGSGGFSLLRAMGLDAPTAERMRGSLGAGLKSVPGNAHAPGLAAFAGSAGAGIEGGKAAGDKHIDQQDKYLTRAIAAAQAGNTKAANEALTELRKAQTQQIKEGKGDKASVLNSPEQLYFKAIGATNQDAGIKESAANLRMVGTQMGVDSKEYKAARLEHEKRIKATQQAHFARDGLDPKEAAKMAGKPGFSDQNPLTDFPKDKAAAEAKIASMPDGTWYKNPSDGRLLIKQSKQPAAAGANPAAPAQSAPPTAPPMLDPAQAIAPAAAEEED